MAKPIAKVAVREPQKDKTRTTKAAAGTNQVWVSASIHWALKKIAEQREWRIRSTVEKMLTNEICSVIGVKPAPGLTNQKAIDDNLRDQLQQMYILDHPKPEQRENEATNQPAADQR